MLKTMREINKLISKNRKLNEERQEKESRIEKERNKLMFSCKNERRRDKA